MSNPIIGINGIILPPDYGQQANNQLVPQQNNNRVVQRPAETDQGKYINARKAFDIAIEKQVQIEEREYNKRLSQVFDAITESARKGELTCEIYLDTKSSIIEKVTYDTY